MESKPIDWQIENNQLAIWRASAGSEKCAASLLAEAFFEPVDIGRMPEALVFMTMKQEDRTLYSKYKA